MALVNNRRRSSLPSQMSASSHTAEAWVMVTSLSTPSPATTMAQVTRTDMCICGAMAPSRRSSSPLTPVKCDQVAAHIPSPAHTRMPKIVPTRAVVVRMLTPWVRYSTRNMIARLVTTPMSSGSRPMTRAGIMNVQMSHNANPRATTARTPRHLATAMTTTRKMSEKAIIEWFRSKSRNW